MTSSPVVGALSCTSALIDPTSRTYPTRHPELGSGPISRFARSPRFGRDPTARPLSPARSAGAARWVLNQVQDDEEGEQGSFRISRGLLLARLARSARLGLGRRGSVGALALARLLRRTISGRLGSLRLGLGGR